MKRSALIRKFLPLTIAFVAVGGVVKAWMASIQTEQPAPDPSAAGEAKVRIQAFQFMPPTITIPRGGSVTFTNLDSTPHTVTPEGSAQFKPSGRLKLEESITITFEVEGEQTYFCDIHPSIKGVVVVTA